MTLLAVPPVLPLIHRDLALDETAVAALTGLPVLLLGLIAIPGSLLIARIGPRRALISASPHRRRLGVARRRAVDGDAVRHDLPDGGRRPVIQPALPSLVSRWFAERPVLATAVYANGLLIGETLSAALTIP